MPTYTTRTALQTLLPSSLPAALTTTLQDQYIADGSAYVDGMVGKRFPILSSNQKFADITDSPATPALIELCARWVAAHFAWLKLGEINRSEPTNASRYLEMADAKLKEIRDGEVEILTSAGANAASRVTSYSTTSTRDATFTRGKYVDGVLEGDAGTLDDLTLD